MTGTVINVVGIVIGGVVGAFRRSPLSSSNEAVAKIGIAVFLVFYGLRLTAISMSGPFMNLVRQFLILIGSMLLGRLIGRLCRLQKMSNRVGQWAQGKMKSLNPPAGGANEGFKACAALFCTEPLAILGAVQDGLTSPSYFYTLAIKGVVDGLATMGLVRVLGRNIILSAIPVLAFQGTVTLICARLLQPVLSSHDLVAPVNMVGGLLVFCVALVVLGLRKIELADYMPSLVIAPLLASLWS